MIAGIDAAQASALRPVKVNAVLVRGVNDDEVEAFAAFARDRDLIMRFIEFMPLDADRAWSRELFVPRRRGLSANFGAMAAGAQWRTNAARRRANTDSPTGAARSA